MKRPFPWTWALLALLPVIPLWRCVFLGEIIGPWDQISHFWPFAPQPVRGSWDVLQADSALQFYGWRDLVFRAWGSGQIPFWNPFQLCGTPLLTNSQSAPFYPLHILMGVLHVPTGTAITLLAWFHLAIAGFGTRFLALKCGANEHGATVGGALFSLSAFVLGWLPLASVVTTVAWIPWVLAGALALIEKPVPRRAVGLALAIAMMALGGHIQFLFYGLLALLVLVIGRLVTAGRTLTAAGPAVAWGVAAVALGLGVSSIQVLPVVLFSKQSHRQVQAGEAGYAAYVAGAPKPYELAGMVYPGALGYPGRAEEGVEGKPYPQHWPASTRIGASFAESALGIGPAVLLLLAGLRKRRSWFVAGPVSLVGVLGLLLALGTPLDAALYFGVPGWAATGSPGRAGILFVLCACAVAALGWPEEGEEPNVKLTLAVAGAGLFATILVLMSAKGLPVWANPSATVESQVSRRLFDILPVGLATLLLAGVFVWAHKSKRFIVAIGALLAAHLATQVTTVVPSAPFPQADLSGFEQSKRYGFQNSGWPLLFVAEGALLPPDLATTLRVHDVAGYDSLLHRDAVTLMHEIDGQDAAPEANGNMQFLKPGFDVAKAAEAGVSRVFLPQGQSVAPEAAPGIVSSTGAEAKIANERGDGLDIATSGSGSVTVRVLNLPGWQVMVDGRVVTPSAGRWIVFDAPSQPAIVQLRYTPPGFDNGKIYTLASLLLLGAMMLARPLQTGAKVSEVEPALAT